MDLKQLGYELARARLADIRFEDYPCPPPADLNQAYRVQNEMAANMGSPVVGWKVGVTSEVARKMLGLDEPFSGPLFKNLVMPSPAKFNVTSSDLRIVEVEIGFRMKSNFESKEGVYTKQEITAGIATVHPVFEIVNKRLPGNLKENGCWLVADGGVNHAFTYGPGVDFDTSMNLAAETVTVNLNGEFATDGLGANALGNPLDVVVWLANHLNARNKSLNAGDWISTGLIGNVIIAEPGATLVATYKTLGTVSLELV